MTGPFAASESERCARCEGPNVIWYAPSPLWNFVMRGNDPAAADRHCGMVCPQCFMVCAAEAGLTGAWRLSLVPEPEGLVRELTDGRVYDAATDLWGT